MYLQYVTASVKSPTYFIQKLVIPKVTYRQAISKHSVKHDHHWRQQPDGGSNPRNRKTLFRQKLRDRTEQKIKAQNERKKEKMKEPKKYFLSTTTAYSCKLFRVVIWMQTITLNRLFRSIAWAWGANEWVSLWLPAEKGSRVSIEGQTLILMMWGRPTSPPSRRRRRRCRWHSELQSRSSPWTTSLSLSLTRASVCSCVFAGCLTRGNFPLLSTYFHCDHFPF